MPTVSVDSLAAGRTHDSTLGNPLPSLIHTPSGLALIELQGSISSEEPQVAEAIALGRLVFPAAEGDNAGTWDQKRVMLYVGEHQRLTGEVRKLPKPIAVVRRKAATADEPDSAGMDDEVEIAEIVYYKMLFKNRPEPLGGQQQQQLEGV